MDTQTDAVPSTPRLVSAGASKNISEPSEQTEKFQPQPNVAGSESYHQRRHAKDESKYKGKKKGDKQHGKPTLNQNIVIAHSQDVTFSLGNTINVHMCGHHKDGAQSPQYPDKVHTDIPEDIKALFSMKIEFTPEHMNIVSECLSEKGLRRLGKLLSISEADMDRAKDDFLRKGIREVIFQTLLEWSHHCGNNKRELFPTLCQKLWEVQKDGGRQALELLSSSFDRR